VTVTPTYSGARRPKRSTHRSASALAAAGAPRVRIEQRLAPAWTTDWITADGKRRLAEFGIAPPGPAAPHAAALRSTFPACALRANEHRTSPSAVRAAARRGTHLLSQFGSTACKAHYRCLDLSRAVRYFKPH
jgi:ring-1,2-phenylacetyl-CoA epoxidase subunit PaaD